MKKTVLFTVLTVLAIGQNTQAVKLGNLFTNFKNTSMFSGLFASLAYFSPFKKFHAEENENLYTKFHKKEENEVKEEVEKFIKHNNLYGFHDCRYSNGPLEYCQYLRKKILKTMKTLEKNKCLIARREQAKNTGNCSSFDTYFNNLIREVSKKSTHKEYGSLLYGLYNGYMLDGSYISPDWDYTKETYKVVLVSGDWSKEYQYHRTLD